MGSLMAGWDSPVLDPKHVAYQRNRSFTIEEIEAYRRSEKVKAEEELRKAPSDGARELVFEGRARKYERSDSLPAELEAGTTWETLINSRGWTAYYGQCECYGSRANTSKWVPRSHNLTSEEASPFLMMDMVGRKSWLRNASSRFNRG